MLAVNTAYMVRPCCFTSYPALRMSRSKSEGDFSCRKCCHNRYVLFSKRSILLNKRILVTKSVSMPYSTCHSQFAIHINLPSMPISLMVCANIKLKIIYIVLQSMNICTLIGLITVLYIVYVQSLGQ